ncbi:hypothetical protein [Chryseobacterium herbae]|uniref:Uncharacterized protein n=1 Tax=Chryseobacterium herbae TaxID=2976476 RepID=A0ABT2J1B4_9FLAO|nr:hypothetical protein [Chryseobacterium sp. pc1-10]MCT2564702.1 hypothetical protein [Chryseobacterium sp. pc1-10]
MKKIPLLLSALAGVLAFAQTSPLVIQNYSAYNAEGRLRTSPISAPGPYMYAAPNIPYGSYTIPAGGFTQYNTFSTSGTAAYPITSWYVTDPTNPANNGTYAYTHPFIASVMNPSNVWAGFHFVLKDPVTQNGVDTYQMGDPAVDPWFVNTATGSVSSADWFTITTPSGPTTYLQIF